MAPAPAGGERVIAVVPARWGSTRFPGKALALSGACFPEAVLGPMPHLYPFIVNDPGEGSQAAQGTTSRNSPIRPSTKGNRVACSARWALR